MTFELGVYSFGNTPRDGSTADAIRNTLEADSAIFGQGMVGREGESLATSSESVVSGPRP